MYRQILVASDLTEASMPALRHGLELARRLDAEVTVIHVTQPPYGQQHWFTPFLTREGDWLRELVGREREAARRVLDDQVKSLSEPHERPSVKVLVRAGVPVDEIVAAAKEVAADLIVMGTHGRKGVQHAMLGSIAERVIRLAPCAVLTVRSRSGTVVT